VAIVQYVEDHNVGQLAASSEPTVAACPMAIRGVDRGCASACARSDAAVTAASAMTNCMDSHQHVPGLQSVANASAPPCSSKQARRK